MAAVLGELYDRFLSASARGDSDAARAELLAIVGLDGGAPVLPGGAELPTVQMLRYSRPRQVDLIALRERARDVAKFEDLSHESAVRLERMLATMGLRAVIVGPYRKRFDVSMSGSGEQVFAVNVARGNEAHLLQQAERDRSAHGTREAGKILGYPACCVEHFIEVSASRAAHDYGINEASLRSFARGGEIAWELNPLSSLALVGFMPCSGDCSAALVFARSIAEALRRSSADAARKIELSLRMPVLFFRFPLFYLLTGRVAANGSAVPQGAVAFERALLNDDGRSPESLRLALHGVLGGALARSRGVRLDAESLVFAGEDGPTRCPLTSPRVPLLLRPRG